MLLKLIVVRSQSVVEDTHWVAGAWDEYTLDENPSGFEDDVKKAQGEHGADNVRILDVKIPEDALAYAFEIPQVEGDVA